MENKWKKLSMKIANIIFDIFIFIFGIILLISIYNGIQVKILGNTHSSFFGYSIFEVQTGSMADEINIGDWIVVKYSPSIKLNDVVTYEKDGDLITHRIVEVYKDSYVTMGDANNTKDDPINKNQVVGKVIKILPYFGIFRKTIFNPAVLVALMITFYFISLLFKDDKKVKISFINKIIDKFNKKTKDEPFKEEIVISKIEEKPIIKESISEEKNISKETINEEVNKPNETYNLDEISKEPLNDEDLDKTVFFRVIPVDKSDIDGTFKKSNSISEEETVIKKNISIEEEIDEQEEDSLIKNSLEMLQNKKGKKCKNILEKTILIKKEELEEMTDILTFNNKLKVNESSIRDAFIEAYIDAKYYNHCGNINTEYTSDNVVSKTTNVFKELANKLAKSYKGSDNSYNDKITKYINVLITILHIEQTNELIVDTASKKEIYKKKILKYLKDGNLTAEAVMQMTLKILKIQRISEGMLAYSLKKLETNMFELKYNQLLSKKKMYGLELNHNISFNKVYSDYIVDKTYNEGIIAEDRIIILISLLLVQLVKDMFSFNFSKRYVFTIPESLYAKENKLNKLFKMIDDEFAKNSIIILIKYSDFIKNKKVVKSLKKSGYKFAFTFSEEGELKEKDYSNLYIADYLFMNKKDPNISLIPNDIVSNIINEDITSKVDDFGGE